MSWLHPPFSFRLLHQTCPHCHCTHTLSRSASSHTPVGREEKWRGVPHSKEQDGEQEEVCSVLAVHSGSPPSSSFLLLLSGHWKAISPADWYLRITAARPFSVQYWCFMCFIEKGNLFPLAASLCSDKIKRNLLLEPSVLSRKFAFKLFLQFRTAKPGLPFF